jgi:Astacin (Peptidase family M12A)
MKRLCAFLCSAIWLCGPVALAHDITAGRPANWDPPIPTKSQREATDQVNALRYVIDRYKLWGAGSTLRVCFFGGEPDIRRAVADIAREWTRYAHISFDFGQEAGLRSCAANEPSHVRVGFQSAGNWSYVGRDSISVDLSQPSMNLEVAGGKLALIDPHELHRVVLHEFGHALGLQHEHQSPNSGCEAQFNWGMVYAELAKPPNNWTRQTVDTNLRELVLSPRLEISPYDPKSIMHYSLPSWMFTGGQSAKCFVAPNEALSQLDELGAAAAYPNTLADQSRYLDTLDRAARQVLAERRVPSDVAKGVEDQINASLEQGFPGRKFQVVCAQQGVAVGGNVSGSTITNTVTNSTVSGGSCVDNPGK